MAHHSIAAQTVAMFLSTIPVLAIGGLIVGAQLEAARRAPERTPGKGASIRLLDARAER
jgi:hypothetical protein